MIKKIEYDDRVVWFLNGAVHRVDGPAIERADGSKEWWINDSLHREDGPAVEGPSYQRWYLNDYLIDDLALYLNRYYPNCIGQFLYEFDKEYLIFCFERDNYYFYAVLCECNWEIGGKRYDCSLKELKSLLC